MGPSQNSTLGAPAVPRTLIEESIVTLSYPQQLPSTIIREPEGTSSNFSPSGRPLEYNTMVFTPEMIRPVPYDPSQFKPICIDGVQVPENLIKLASLSPSFSPTPSMFQPPNGQTLHEDLTEYKRVFSWRYKFRAADFRLATTVEEFVNMEQPTFTKPPWYQNSTLEPPPLPDVLENAFHKIYSTVMNPENWYKFSPNLSGDLRQALLSARNLPSQGVGTYLQDKSSRICFASLSKTNAKVEMVLSDEAKYKRLPRDMASLYQPKIRSWYNKYKRVLSNIDDDVSEFLVPEKVATPHLKAMIKTHKRDCPVRLTFSSRGSTTSHLSTVLDYAYLKPTVESGLCNRRLGDTRDALLFIEKINDYLWQNNIQTKPTIFALDVSNFFPSVKLSLALPAIKKYLYARGIGVPEVQAVLEGLKIVRNGNFFKWREGYFNQISGCALGDPDSCSYCDLTMADLLDRMIPDCENDLSINLDPFFKVYRDDGLGFTLESPTVVLDILRFFNSYEESIQWTIPHCQTCSLPEVTCPHYECLEFLDCRITWKQVLKAGVPIWQFQVSSYSKPTDCHAYLAPTSCTAPHLNSKGVSLAKTVGTRLRTLHTNDHELLLDLNLYSGYMIARGYQEDSIKYHLACMANRSRDILLRGQYQKHRSFIVPFVTSLHPSTTMLTPLVKQAIQEAAQQDPSLQYIVPPSSVLVAYKKLPNLQLLLCRNDQNALVTRQDTSNSQGHVDTGCKCLVCKASTFSKYARSPAMPTFGIKIPRTIKCTSGPAIVYHIACTADKPECRLAHYVGMASTSDYPTVFPMRARWSNHKSHSKKKVNKCNLVNHLLTFHRGEDPQRFLKITLLEAADSKEEAKVLEVQWTRKLFAFKPTGLNTREELD